MRRTLLLSLTTIVVTLLLAGGVALAANFTCTGNPCVGTEQNDRITGSLLDDQIFALGGLDVVTARAGDDLVDGGRNRDDIFGGPGGDGLLGGLGPDDIDGNRGTTTASEPPYPFDCTITDDETGSVLASTEGTQVLFGDLADEEVGPGGNDDLDGGIDNDGLAGEGGRNDLSGNGGDDCLLLQGDANERASGGDGDDVIGSEDGNADDVFCGAGDDGVEADANDRVAADCEHVQRPPSPIQATGATPVVEVNFTTPDGTTTMTP